MMTVGNRKATTDRIPIERCHFYGVKSPHLLEKKLGARLSELESLASNGRYRRYNHPETKREIQEPSFELQKLHRKIHRHLSRVETPDYLHSVVKGRSYVTNAKSHVGSHGVIKIDVKKFYPSVPQAKVMEFFRDVLMCAEDVSGLMANLICLNRRLATGSSASPIISYYAYRDMFNEIASLASQRGLVMTCYVDDITISGPGASKGLLHEVRKIIMRSGLKAHKAKCILSTKPKIVTGVLVKSSGVDLPIKRWKKIQERISDFDKCSGDVERLDVLKGLISSLYEAGQFSQRCRILAVKYKDIAKSIRRGQKHSSI